MKKTYDVVYGPNWWECQISIDPNFKLKTDYPQLKTTNDYIKVMVEFWQGWELRLYNNGGDYVKTFLQQLAHEICMIQVESNYNLVGVVSAFENREGWCPMDGSWGIIIIEIDDSDVHFRHTDFEVQEAPAG